MKNLLACGSCDYKDYCPNAYTEEAINCSGSDFDEDFEDEEDGYTGAENQDKE